VRGTGFQRLIEQRIETRSDEYADRLKDYLLDRLDRMSKELIAITKEVEKWRS
jgi:hypothetical protein